MCLLLFLLLLFKVLWFDFSWCVISTFRPFSYAELYVFGILFAAVFLMPFVLFRKTVIVWIVDVMLGFLFVSNLIYFRTYYTAIPLSSYGLAANMLDFTSSVYESLRWEDIMYPLSTLAAAFFCRRRRAAETPPAASGRLAAFGRYMLLVMIFVSLAAVLLLVKGGFKKSYELLQDSYTHTCGTPLYTIAGSLYYDYIRDKEVYTPETGRHIDGWLERHLASGRRSDAKCLQLEASTFLPDGCAVPERPLMPERRMNCIIILAESLESWVLERTVEGQEIMPRMNRLLRDSTTLYAPNVLSQVKGGRSIDAQLMINTGLLPVDIGVYSLKYSQSFFPSLAKALEEKYGEVYACTLTADKPFVWNQSVIAPAFGYDSLVSKNHFMQDEKVGPHYRHQLGDVSLLRQCAGKINDGRVWKDGANLLQIVTYSGHFPFVLPDDLKEVHFSGDIPLRMRDYMTVANYTDRALGSFVEAIRSVPGFDNTLIVITGDHEGLADMRDNLCRDKAGQGIVSDAPFVPFIVLNVPPALRSAMQDAFDLSGAGIRYKKVMGQVDIYPTLLDLLELTDYTWRGMGRSILDPAKKGIAVNAHNAVYGDTTDVSGIQHLKEAWKVSDEIIRYDYFRHK
ncbi:MAG: LTA synthase family protein [Tannerella sp.]|jgi:phosphoglycerol transferase MdoB-like AlkP superfamily enzyme|nr:LTA synthase family protein [Tannerella sp.]